MTVQHRHTARPLAATYQDLLADLKTTMAELQTPHEQAIETPTPTEQDEVQA